MVRSCCAWYCSNRDIKAFKDPPLNIQFYNFPNQNASFRKKWTVAVSSGRRDDFHPSQKTILCSIHFEQSEFSPVKARGRKTGRNAILKADAVPTLFYIPTMKEEIQMKALDPEKKGKVPSIIHRRPRRLRKIYVDERNYIDYFGKSKTSFSFFVLPLPYTRGEVPMAPKFDFPDDDPPVDHVDGGVTVAVVRKDEGAKQLSQTEQEKSKNHISYVTKLMPVSKDTSSITDDDLERCVDSEVDPQPAEQSLDESMDAPEDLTLHIPDKPPTEIIKTGAVSVSLNTKREAKNILVAVPASYKGRVEDFINSAEFAESVYKKKVVDYWRKASRTPQMILGYAHEYENVIPADCRKRSLENTDVDINGGKRRKVFAGENAKYKKQYGLKDVSMDVIKLEQWVLREGASRFQKDLFIKKVVKKAGRPKKVYEPKRVPAPPPVVIKLEHPQRRFESKPVEPVIFEPLPIPPQFQRGNRRGTVNSKATTRPGEIVLDEHNYDDSIERFGKKMVSEMRAIKLQETVNELRKTVRDMKRKSQSKDIAFNKLLLQLKTKSSNKRIVKTISPFENSNVHPVVKELFMCEMKNVELRGKKTRRYTENVKEFCHSIYKISPKAYKFMRGFFNFPNQARIRSYKPNAFSMPAELAPIKPDGIDEYTIRTITINGVPLPTEPVPPMDLEMNDMMYDLDQSEAEVHVEPYIPDSDDDEYEQSILENPPLVVPEFEQDSTPRLPVDDRTIVDPNRSAVKRKLLVKKSIPGKRQRTDEDDDEDEEETISTPSTSHHYVETLVNQQHWIKKPIPQYQPQPGNPPQVVYNLYANPQPGPSTTTGQPIAGSSMPDVYMCSDSLKTFEPYYF